jgi:hypothetical protein
LRRFLDYLIDYRWQQPLDLLAARHPNFDTLKPGVFHVALFAGEAVQRIDGTL